MAEPYSLTISTTIAIVLATEGFRRINALDMLRSLGGYRVDRSDSDSLSEGRALLLKVRQSGFTINLDENDRPKIIPLDRLTSIQKELLKTHRESIRLALLMERKQPCLLTPFDQPPWDTLAAWWLSWEPPAAPYEISPGVMVLDPAFSHAYHADLVRSGCSGQVQVALFDWLKRHAVKFGGPVPQDE